MSVYSKYEYTEGDRIESRNSYFYTPFVGTAFFAAWEASRAPCGLSGKKCLTAPDLIELNEPAFFEMQRWLDAWRRGGRLDKVEMACFYQRVAYFEVSKRLFADYDAQGKPLDRTDYQVKQRYLNFALLLEAAYSHSQDLRCMNALLKVCDTVVSVQAELQQRDVLSWLMARERLHVQGLAQKLGVGHG